MMRWGLATALAVFVADRASKMWLIDLMAAHPGGIRITPFFNLVMVWNPGVSFGLFGTDLAWGRWLLTALSMVIVVFLLTWLYRTRTRWLAFALGLVIGGAVGNVVDRLIWGRVADFFDFHLAGYAWPAFNIADSAIVVGVAVLVADSLWSGRSRR